MITLFQVGDVPLYLKLPMPSNVVVQELDNLTSTVAVSEKPLLFGQRVVYGERPFQQRPQSYTLEGDLYHTEAFDAASWVGKLAEYEGREVNLIGYLHHRGEAFDHPQRFVARDSLHDLPYGSTWGQFIWGVTRWGACPLTVCGVAGEGSLCAVQWLETTGMIRSVQVTPQRMRTPRVQIELSIQPRWTGLNPVFWTYKHGVFQHDVEQDLICECDDPTLWVSRFPTCEQLLDGVRGQLGIFHRRVFDDTLYPCLMEPSAWQVMVDGCPSPYPVGRAVTAQRGAFQYEVFSYPDGFYNAPPTSLYQITNVLTTGVFRMVIQRKDGVWRMRRDVVEVNIEDVNTALNLNGLADVSATDRLIWGDVVYRAGFIVRNGSVLTAGGRVFRLPIAGENGNGYKGTHAGELSPGTNRVAITPPHQEVEFSALHLFGRIA